MRSAGKFYLRLGFGFFLTTLLAIGCAKSADSVGTHHSKAFQSADAETRTTWEIALAGIKTNGYAVAYTALKKLQEQTNLTAEQLSAVNETATAMSDQMYAAANKGDANATKGIQELRELQKR